MAKGERKGVRANGPRIKELRMKKGLSQKALSREAHVTERTLQRAEKSEVVMPGILQAIANTLEVQIDGLFAEGVSRSETTLPDDPHLLLVRLTRTSSANELSRNVRFAGKPNIGWDVDPDMFTAERIAVVIEAVERMAAQGSSQSTADKMRDVGRVNSLLTDLNEAGIGTFVGTYQELHVERDDNQKKVGLISDTTRLIRFSHERGSQLTVRRWTWTTADEARAEVAELVAQGYEVVRDDTVPLDF